MSGEAELMAKLGVWLAARDRPPTWAEVIATGDRELLAAYVLVAFRAAVADVGDQRHGRMFAGSAEYPGTGAYLFRVYDHLAAAWSLTGDEQARLVGAAHAEALPGLREANPLPPDVEWRIGLLLDIYSAIHVLLPEPGRADAWMRKSNKAQLLGGRSALARMLDDREGIEAVRAYLLGQVHGP